MFTDPHLGNLINVIDLPRSPAEWTDLESRQEDAEFYRIVYAILAALCCAVLNASTLTAIIKDLQP